MHRDFRIRGRDRPAGPGGYLETCVGQVVLLHPPRQRHLLQATHQSRVPLLSASRRSSFHLGSQCGAPLGFGMCSSVAFTATEWKHAVCALLRDELRNALRMEYVPEPPMAFTPSKVLRMASMYHALVLPRRIRTSASHCCTWRKRAWSARAWFQHGTDRGSPYQCNTSWGPLRTVPLGAFGNTYVRHKTCNRLIINPSLVGIRERVL